MQRANKLYNDGNEAQNAIELIKSKMNDTNITSYETGNKGEMYTFNHESTNQTPSQTDYRYIGSSPNNHIKFNCDSDGTNCETWRILGVFSVDDGTGNVEQKVSFFSFDYFGIFMIESFLALLHPNILVKTKYFKTIRNPFNLFHLFWIKSNSFNYFIINFYIMFFI